MRTTGTGGAGGATLLPGDRVHLVGIGGAGMSALAWILLERGHAVSGSDLRGGLTVSALEAMGAQVHVGHDAGLVVDAALVARSTAVPDTNPELRRARELGLPVLHRAELLAALVEGREGMFIAGTHGKTTTTSMAVVCLQAAGRDPSFAIGGALHDAGTSAHHGTGEWFVAEADESDRSLLAFAPDCAVVTNVELDHHDVYADLADVTRTLTDFLARRRPGAPAIVCLDDPGASALVGAIDPPVITYGEHPDAEVRLDDLQLRPAGSRARLRRGREDLGELRLRLLGRHNLLNATAAATAALWAGADIDPIRSALASFSGAQRRWQRMGEVRGVAVVDDYAHHPTELAATLGAARQAGGSGRVIAVFQPHRFSRTAAIGEALGGALAAADVAIVTDVYAAGEAPVAGVTSALVLDGVRAAGVEAHGASGVRELLALLLELVQPGDLVLTLGAGDISQVGPQLLSALQGHDQRRGRGRDG